MKKDERIQAIERILWYSHITKCSPKADCPECKEKIRKIATAIEEAIGVDVEQLTFALMRLPANASFPEEAEAISTNKDIITIKENKNE